ncbi:anti-repressor SinI family protein [Numidum massiliense]|uniref:anti-repressor SinI family protein n=1 Tax=Numidum massiliense TaxID=1522315 RepID=UPI0006D5A806|nr:anti-repressor SinI family protein [Numidum massiliense]
MKKRHGVTTDREKSALERKDNITHFKGENSAEEWYRLMVCAKNLGLSPAEVRHFLQQNTTGENAGEQ